MARILVYLLCALTSMACAWLLIRAFRASRTPMLLWSSIGFAILAASNVILFIDLVIIPTVDLEVLRTATALIGMLVLTSGLVRGDSC